MTGLLPPNVESLGIKESALREIKRRKLSLTPEGRLWRLKGHNVDMLVVRPADLDKTDCGAPRQAARG